jgi:hypothetical protein
MSIEEQEKIDRRERAFGGAPTPLGRRAVALLLAAASLAAPAGARGRAAGEYDVKAGFLYNFIKFVEWPEAAFHDDRSSFRLCVLGDDPFGDSLKTVAEEDAAGRKLTIWRMGAMSDPAGCQVLFISRSERQRLSEILTAVRGAPVLTVADTPGFLEQGGIINFMGQGRTVRFEINQGRAEQVGLKISSKLLRLAARVVSIPGARPGP